MSEDLSGVVTAPVPAKSKSKGLLIFALVLVSIGVVVGLSIKGGLFAPSIGDSLDAQLTRQLVDLAGNQVVVKCPPDAKFHAGAIIVCDVTNVSTMSLMPRLGYVDVIVETNNQFRTIPVNQ